VIRICASGKALRNRSAADQQARSEDKQDSFHITLSKKLTMPKKPMKEVRAEPGHSSTNVTDMLDDSRRKV